MSLNIEKICRTCLALNGGPLLSIYDDSSRPNGGCLADMLRELTKTKPMREDKLPEMVCLTCISEINRCYSFKLKCENSARTLRQLLPEAAAALEDFNNKSVQTLETNKVTVEVQTELLVKEEHLQNDQHMESASLTADKKCKRSRVVDNEQVSHQEIASNLKDRELHAMAMDEMDQQNTEEIILELQEDSSDTECFTTLNTIQLECGNNDNNEQEAAGFYELSSTSYEYEESRLRFRQATSRDAKEYAGGDTSNILETTTIFIEEASNVEKSVEQEKYDFTIYDSENGDAEIVARRTRSSTIKVGESPVDTNMLRKPEFKCSSCVMSFVSQKSLRRHVIKFHDYSEMRKDTTTTEEEKKIRINETLNTDQTDSVVVSETLNAIEDGPTTSAKLSFFCERCNAGFALRKSLAYHWNLNACTAITYKCNECDRVFVSEKKLKEHKLTHILKSECSECKKCFETNKELSNHMVEEHNRNIRNQCNVCKKVFTMLSALKDHMRVHTGERPFLCTLCGKSFSQNTNLKQHVMRHSKDKRFKCNECASSYVTKAELFSHQRTHTGDHPFKCEYCQASFTTSSTLLKHKRKHTGERPYACEFCPMRFTVLNVLKNHRRTHTGEKPFKCKYCNKGFAQKGDCHIHQRTHTGERNYICHCNEKFTHLATLRTHMKVHEKDNGRNPLKRRGRKPGKACDKVQHFTILNKDGEETDLSAEMIDERQISDGGAEEVLVQIEMEDI